LKKYLTKSLHIINAIRIRQWPKNALLFSSLFASHNIFDQNNWKILFFAFLSFSFSASLIYIINDINDIESDKKHPQKKNRPFASGVLNLKDGVLICIGLFFSSIILNFYFLPNYFYNYLFLYIALSITYSLILKKIILLDCLCLAFLYTLRIIAGVSLSGANYSFWFISFSIFFFLSLAFLKRYSELRLCQASKLPGRGYLVSDLNLIGQLGIVSGFISTLIFLLYMNTPEVIKLYKSPELLFGALSFLVLWISYIWLKAERLELDDDPFMFAITNKISLLILLFFASFLISSTFITL